MGWRRIYFERLLWRIVLIMGIGLMCAKAAMEDGGDGKSYAMWILYIAGIYFVIGMRNMTKVAKMRSEKEKKSRDKESEDE